MKSLRALLTALLLGCAMSAALAQTPTPFLVKPYLQLGDAPALTAKESLVVMWHTEDTDADWAVEFKPAGQTDWNQADVPTMKKIAVPTIPAHRLYSAAISGLKPGEEFAYRVLKGGMSVFEAQGRARKGIESPFRFVVFGDCAEGTPGQKAIAYQTYQLKPDFVLITGDIVYKRGRISEYREKFFPVYNADDASATVGAPLTRSTLFFAAPGNHDILHRELDTAPDSMAYYYWAQPLNGPLKQDGAENTPTLSGPKENQDAIRAAAGTQYPVMANFSFDYGCAHWTVLDANPYVNWSEPALRDWLAKDLASAQSATWRFVAFHQPGFNSSKDHFSEQQMRVVADLFEKGNVDIVFNGHVHNYQRSYPLRFTAKPGAVKPALKNGEDKGLTVDGTWTLDKAFDGKTKTKPDGVLYLITGGGGAHLYNPEQEDDRTTWQEFTAVYKAKIHSLTAVDVDGKTLKVRQISEEGKELDTFTLTK